MGATQGSSRVGQEAEAVRGRCRQEPLLWFPREGTDKAEFRIGKFG